MSHEVRRLAQAEVDDLANAPDNTGEIEMIDINELRKLAKAATPPQGWYVQLGDYIYGCKDATDGDGDGDGDGEEGWRPVIANTEDGEPVNFEGSVAAFIAVASPAAVLELLDRLEAAESEALEQARLNGIGAERELALMAKLEAAEKERSADSETPTIDWQSSCEMWKRAHEKVGRIASELQDTVHKQAQQLSRWEASYNAVCDERDAIAKDADKAYMLLRWAETEMRYAGWGYRAADNHGRTDVFEAVVGFLK